MLHWRGGMCQIASEGRHVPVCMLLSAASPGIGACTLRQRSSHRLPFLLPQAYMLANCKKACDACDGKKAGGRKEAF